MASKGDTVWAIIKSASTFRPEIIQGTVTKVEGGEIKIRKEETKLTASVYAFPEHEWGRSIFQTEAEARAILYGEEGAEWRIRHGLAAR